MYKPGVVLVLPVRGITGMYELVKKYSKARSMAKHGKARQSTALRSAELELQGIAGHCTALRCCEL